MKINTVRTLLWVVDVALVAAAGLVIADVHQAKQVRAQDTAKFRAELAARLGAIKVESVKSAPRYGPDAFSGVSLSNEIEKPVVETAPVIEKAATTYEPIENVVRILAIQWSENQDEAKVALFPKSAKDPPNERVIFGVQDLVFFANDAVVKEIRQSEVVFFYGGQGETQTLRIQTDVTPDRPTAMPPPTGAVPGGRGSLASGIEYNPKSSVMRVKKEGRAALEQDGEKILDGVTLGTTDLGNGEKGLKIESLKPGNELGNYGVQTGDILVSVNGTAMGSKSEVMEYLKKNSKASRYDVVFLRSGVRLTRQVNVDQ